jgi:hypothetical protein
LGQDPAQPEEPPQGASSAHPPLWLDAGAGTQPSFHASQTCGHTVAPPDAAWQVHATPPDIGVEG